MDAPKGNSETLTSCRNIQTMTATRAEVEQALLEYYELPHDGLGGNLHIVIEDQNIRDSDIQFCKEQAEAEGDELGVLIADALMQMSKTQRLKIASKYYYPD